MTTSLVALNQDYWSNLGRGVGAIVLYAIVGLVLMVVGFYAIDLTTPGPLRKMVNAGKPNAIIVTAAGIVSMAFITGLYGFCTLRVLLGLAEAGFFPGVVLYLTYWFPRAYRARVIAGFLVSVPLTGAFGAPLATSLMQIEGWGLRSWQWLFLLEGIPSVLIGIVSLWYLTDRPSKADWLRPEQRDWLERGKVVGARL